MSSIRQQRTRRSKKALARQKIRETLSLLLAAGAVLLVIWIILRATTGVGSTPPIDTFCDGVYVNGISMGGYTYEEGYAAVEQHVNERLHAEITLSFEGKTWKLTPAMLGASMSFQTQVSYAWNFGHVGTNAERRAQLEELKEENIEFNSTLVYDEERLDEFIENVKSEIDIAPVEATVVVGADEILSVTESKNGRRIDGDALKAQIQELIVEGGASDIALAAQLWEPESSTETAVAGTSLITSVKTVTAKSSSNRIKNIKRALKPFDGFELKPGAQLNFNAIVGKRTLENGFYESVEFAGTDVVEGIGGGTCQASTTLYQACLKAGLTVIDRSPHTMRVGYTQPSLDAAVSDRGKNLIVQNDLGHSVYFYTSVDTERAEVKVYGMPSQYIIELEFEITQDNIVAKGYKTKPDTDGKYVYYTTDTPVLYEEGKFGCRSRGYRVYFNAQTGEEVDRQLLSTDYYYPTQSTFWVGVHSPDAW
ncbi:MAG: VanW family protein [Christensenellales bacterium]|jgi:vancomycin resistance protein YoaR